MKIIYALIPMLATPIIASGLVNEVNIVETKSIDTSNKKKVLDMNFNNNKSMNTVNKKEYSLSKSSGKYVASVKGNGFEPNGSKVSIPFSDLGISSTDSTITVSFLFKYEGKDTNFMPIGISGNGEYNGANDLWFYNGSFGFNTGKGDLYGLTSPLIVGEFVSVIAEFNQNDISKNKLYINGVKQDLSYVVNSSSYACSWDENATISIGAFPANDDYTITDLSIIDEVKIFKGSLNNDEIKSVTNAHKIPELRGEVVNNSYPKMSWATEILPENVLWSLGYELEEQSFMNLTYNASNGLGTGGQEFRNDDAFTGNYSVYTPNSYPDKGNAVAWPYTSTTVNNHIYYQNKKIGLENGIPISTSFRLKGEGTLKANIYSDWNYINTFRYHNATYLEDYPVGTKEIKVSNYSLFKLGTHVTVDPDPYKHERNNHVAELNDETQTIILSKPLNYAVKAGDKVKYRATSTMMSFPVLSTKGNGEWQLYNLNSVVSNPANYNWSEHPVILRQSWSSNQYAYFDDLTVGHATKVRLYRDGTKVYEGYESEFNDTTAKDKSVPTSVSEISSTMEMINPTNSTRRININFNESRDAGTEYDYQISALSKEGVETPKGETLTQIVTSGVKGYSYVIDKSATTNPDNTVDTTSTNITKDITDSGVYYLHIKTIDNAGNVSGTTHYKIDIPNLTAKANPNQNNIRLDWIMNDINNKIFKVYQKKTGSNEFQTISSTNFAKTKQVKVLNVHPNAGSNISYTTWDGEIITDVKSASLKQWMEEPNSEHPKGYGKGLIEVTPVTIQDFNVNPSKYLSKDNNGNYNYDVIMFGTWDSNGNNYDLNQDSLNEVKLFVDTGRGLLLGHDTLRQGTMPMFTELRKYINIETPGDKNISSSYQNVKYSVVSKDILKKKEGLLTNYPWVIDKTQLIVPTTHSSRQWAYGDIWFDFTNIDTTIYPGYEGIIYNGVNGKGTNNFYLTTWNNASMIQTGHSNGQATPDEQKILANTLFYLNQLSSDNYLNDNSGQDVTAPNKPVIYGHNFTGRGKVEVNFKEVTDNGSTYEYYVQSEDKNGQVTLSNTAKETITSGLKGYSYVVDSSPNTVPDTNIELSKVESIKVNINDNTEKYVHIRAIDNVGNGSETYHYKITESTKPTMTITGNPTEWTGENVTLNVTADDLDSGMDYIVLPNGNRVAGQTASYTVTTNGSYIFKAVDRMGNETVQTVVVDKIDNSNPQLSYRKELSADKTSMNLVISGYDSQSGVDYFVDPEGNKRTEGFTYKITNNGVYPFSIYDKVGRVTSIYIQVTELNTNINPSEIDRIEYKLSGATIKDWTVYDKPFYVTNEGITTITARAYDKAGNLSSETTSVVKIDKTKPNNNSILIELK